MVRSTARVSVAGGTGLDTVNITSPESNSPNFPGRVDARTAARSTGTGKLGLKIRAIEWINQVACVCVTERWDGGRGGAPCEDENVRAEGAGGGGAERASPIARPSVCLPLAGGVMSPLLQRDQDAGCRACS